MGGKGVISSIKELFFIISSEIVRETRIECQFFKEVGDEMSKDVRVIFLFPLSLAVFSETIMDMGDRDGVVFSKKRLGLDIDVEGCSKKVFFEKFIIGDEGARTVFKKVFRECSEVFGKVVGFNDDFDDIFRDDANADDFMVRWFETCGFDIDNGAVDGEGQCMMEDIITSCSVPRFGEERKFIGEF